MSEYDEQVQAQRLKLEAEEWAKGVKSLHSHSLKSMWYDTRPQDTDNGSVQDIQFNDGRVQRTINKTVEVVIVGKQITEEELVDKYKRKQQ